MSLRASDFFQIAKVGAEQFRDRVLAQPVTSVVVQTRFQIGENWAEAEDSYPRCHADVFEPGVLTITAIDNGYVMRRYQAEQWTRAVARHDGGHIAYALTQDSEPQEGRRTA